MTAPYVINGQEYIDNADCPFCGQPLAVPGSWVRDHIDRNRWHPNCWVREQERRAAEAQHIWEWEQGEATS